MRQLRLARDGYIVMSIVFYIAGLVYIFCSDISPLTICITGGVVLIVYGIIKVIGYFSNDLYCLAFRYDLACGLFLMVLGVIMLACNQRIIAHLSAGLGVLVLLDSLLSIQTSKDAKQFGLETWTVILVTSIIAAVFSVLLIVKPYHSPKAAHIVAGGTLLAEGLKNHCVVILTVKTIRSQPPPNK